MWRWLSDATSAVADGVSASAALVGTAVAGVQTVVSAATSSSSAPASRPASATTSSTATAAASVTASSTVAAGTAAQPTISTVPEREEKESDAASSSELLATTSTGSGEWQDVDGNADEWQAVVHGQDDGTHVVVPLRHIDYEDSDDELPKDSQTEKSDKDRAREAYEEDLMAHASMSVYGKHPIAVKDDESHAEQKSQAKAAQPQQKQLQQSSQSGPKNQPTSAGTDRQSTATVTATATATAAAEGMEVATSGQTTPTKDDASAAESKSGEQAAVEASVEFPWAADVYAGTQRQQASESALIWAEARRVWAQYENDRQAQDPNPWMVVAAVAAADDQAALPLLPAAPAEAEQETWQVQLRPQALARKRRHAQTVKVAQSTKLQVAQQQRGLSQRSRQQQQQHPLNRGPRASRKF